MKFRKMDTAGILLSCFAEDPKQYRGLIISQLDKNTLGITLGQTSSEVELPPSPECEILVEKQGFVYQVSLNGEKVLENVESAASEYDGNLYLGCSLNEKGVPFRFSEVKILQLDIEEKQQNTEEKDFS